MSWAEENNIDIGIPDEYMPEIQAEIDRQTNTIVLGNGAEICKHCGSKNIKVSKKGNKYCADLCWVDSSSKSNLLKEE